MGRAAQDGHCQRSIPAFIKTDRVLMTAYDDHDVDHEGISEAVREQNIRTRFNPRSDHEYGRNSRTMVEW